MLGCADEELHSKTDTTGEQFASGLTNGGAWSGRPCYYTGCGRTMKAQFFLLGKLPRYTPVTRGGMRDTSRPRI